MYFLHSASVSKRLVNTVVHRKTAVYILTLPSDNYGSREQISSEMYEESETDGGMEDYPARIFVALFDYDPRTMSPNPDAAEEELPFKEGQIIKVTS